MKSFFAHETSVIDSDCKIGDGTSIWHFSHIMSVRCWLLIDTSATNDNKPKIINESVIKEVKNEISKPESNTKSHIASPSARKIIDEKNMDTSSLKGTGKDGRVTKDDAVNSKPSMGSRSK